MTDGLADRYAAFLADRYRLVAVAVLLLTAVVAAGAVVGETADGGIGQFETDTPERAALEEIEADYPSDDAVVTQVVVRDGNVLSRDSLLSSLRLQRDLRANDTVGPTLREEQGTVGLENVIATAAYYEDRSAGGNATGGPPGGSSGNASAAGQQRPTAPTLDEQVAALESRNASEVEALVGRVLDPDAETPGGDPYQFLPSSYRPGATTADARITFVFQADDSGPDADPTAAYDAQLAIESLVEERFDDAFAFGQGITDDASSRAVGDSFAIITPVALVLVLLVLGVAYRDVADVLVGVFGIATVLAWLAGIQGWLGVPSSQLLIAVPFLLIGLSIDYSLHVVMRYREAREGTLRADDDAVGRRSPAQATRLGVAGVVFALGAATFSTGIGFLSNYVSPLAAIRDFAVLSAGGILATFVVFGALVPAVKLGVENAFDRLGFERRKPAVGLEAGPINRGLSGAVALARRAPVGVVVLSLLLASAGAYGATGIDTEFNRADFLPEDAPAWADSLPGPLAPGDYDVREHAAYLGDNFRQRGQGSEAQVLLRGNVTDPATLRSLDAATNDPERGGAVVVRSDGTAAVEGPHTLLREVAAENDTVAAAVGERDADGDGLPDRDVAAVYDLLYDAAPDRAAEHLARTDGGEYASARLVVGVQGDAAAQTVAGDVRAFAAAVASDAPVTAVATGGPVTTAVLQDALLETLVEAFAVTLLVVLAFLTALYWRRHGAPGLGVVTLVPVLVALAWLLGTMRAFGIAFNSETAVITSLAIGLGVDYSIHLGERVVEERKRRDEFADALSAAVTGTGGALLGSAATTAAGFGVLSLALAPPLQRFGIVTGLSIVYAFIACLTVLPCLLILRERALARFA
ncbi:efflux RND transporter permease subunit [Halostella litorea]|uniref:efflux RND transporter permease subunit n=1 Tax=Halostella litorea TaxID=2528831 RepID=UPI001091A028|nr:MMPL family transporter [Halostella litorea]